MQAFYSYGPSRPLYSGAPDLNWAPSSRVTPAKVTVTAPAAPPVAPLPAAPRTAPSSVAAAVAAPARPVRSVREMLEASARQWRAKHPGRKAIQVAPGVVEIALSVRVGTPRAGRAAARVAAIPAPEPGPRTAQLPALAPIGTTVSLASPAPAAPAAITSRELLPIEALRPAAPAEAPVAVAEPAQAEPEAPEPQPEAAEPEVIAPQPEVLEATIAVPEPAPVEPEVEAALEAPAEVAEAPVEPAEAPPEPAPAAVVEAVVPEAPAMREVDWQILVLSGPAGSGKSSVAYQLGQYFPKAAHIKVEPLRDRAYSTLIGQVIVKLGTAPTGTGPLPSAWSGPTSEAREKAIELAREYVADGYVVIIDDVIESAAELQVYLAAVEDLVIRAVTLMPSVDEMERRDKMRPVDQRIGTRIADARAAMARQLGAQSAVLDTSDDTVESTAQRILDALAEPA